MSKPLLYYKPCSLLRKGCRQENPLVSLPAPQTHWKQSFWHETTIKVKCTSPGVLWVLHLSLPCSACPCWGSMVKPGQSSAQSCVRSAWLFFFFFHYSVGGEESSHAPLLPHAPSMQTHCTFKQQRRWWTVSFYHKHPANMNENILTQKLWCVRCI